MRGALSPSSAGVSPNPALFDNLCYTYLVEDARKTRDLSLDASEDIEVELVLLCPAFPP